jgi:predicted signal transduction protein with EAL and GGDEF domain
MGQIPAPRSSLANRLRLALAAMLLPAAAGLVTFRLSISALEEFRAETVDESTRIEAVRHLLVEADGHAEGRAIVYAITSLAAALGVRVTGEGTKTASQLSTLVELDCKHGQGFLLGRPAPAGELTELLRTVNTGELTVAARLARLQ